ncbi:alpha-2-macroglobulin family protein [Variovorax sp. GB1R11]|uniref:alpha-2-macroglobulin family protein n=1 Tax=Variovorax sp. GB1R11 TaxID=3443741 RepID=UPI003F4699D0
MAENHPKRIIPLPAGSAWLRLLALAVVFAAAPSLHAAGVLGVSPQGEARDVRQVSVRFDADMVPLGQSDGAEPATVQCSAQTPEGRARWIGPRVWAFEFAADVRGGTRCNVVFKPGLKTLAGEAVVTPPAPGFVAGPYGFFDSYPAEGGEVAPDQVFLLRHHAPQPTDDPRVLAAGFTCEQRVGDKVLSQPAVPVTGAALAAAVNSASPGPYALALRCAQPVPEGAQLSLSQAGAGNAAARRFNYTVRPAFKAELSCTVLDYPQGQKACDPRRALFLRFSGYIDPAVAGALRVVDAAGTALSFDPVEPRRRENIRELRMSPPNGSFGEGTRYTVRLPDELRDVFARPLVNAAEFPKTVEFARLPPYLGAANPLAVMPWQAGQSDAVAAFAVRRVEKSVPLRQWRLGGEMGEGIEAYAIELLQAQQSGQWPAELLNAKAGTSRTSTLATQGEGMEFVGVPLSAPGLHVVRADSAAFTQYIDTRPLGPNETRDATPRQRYAVVQATNLNPGASFSDSGASVIWVTAFDSARPVAGADVAVYSCNRELLWRGKTDAQGLARPDEALRGKLACSASGANPMARRYGYGGSAWVVVRAGNDMALLQASAGWSGYNAGRAAQNLRAHTVLDRTLFKAGETVSLQHVVRVLESRGFALPPAGTLDVEIRSGWSDKVHAASVPLGADGSASHQWTIPLGAKLGVYTVQVSQGGRQLASARFQVEEFRTPVFDSELRARALWERDAQLAVVDARLSYFAGGAAAGLPVSVQQGWTRDVQAPRAGYAFYEEALDTGLAMPPPMAPKDAKLDAAGKTQVRLKAPPLERPMLLQTELGFQDPNGETQTAGTSTMLWPDRMKLGLRVRAKDRDRPQAIEGIALDANDQPVADEPVKVRVKPVKQDWNNNRARFTDLGPETEVCSTRTDAQGQWSCEWQLPAAVPGQGQIPEQWLFDASAASLKHSRAVVRTAMLQQRWHLGWQEAAARSALQLENGPSFGPGDKVVVVARPERLPAHLLLTTEREGVMSASVHALGAMAQRIEVPLVPQHAPNVYLTARYVYPLQGADKAEPLASTQRADVPVRPDAWTLSVGVRPAGTSARPRTQVPMEVAVRDAAGQPVGDARVTLVAVDQALLALKPNDTWGLAHAMFAARGNAVTATALDARLLRRFETGPQPHYRPSDEADRGAPGGVPMPAPAVAAMAMGRRPGEAGGAQSPPPRSDLSSLIAWRTDLRTDAQGIARVTVPLNDALTQFRIVAIASAGEAQFGQGETTITSTQPLQIFSGLPELLRADDAIVQKLSLRNTGTSPLAVLLRAEASVEPNGDWPGARDVVPADALAARGLKIERRVQLAAGQTQEVLWPVAVPAGAGTLRWRISAQGGEERDALEVAQRVVPALPVTVRQSTLLSVADAGAVPVAQPRDAVPLTGGVRVALQSSLVDAALAESMRWMAQYPYMCLEQQSSRFVSLDDRAGWDRLMAGLPKYIDDKGLARFFPEATLAGSEMLTVQLLDLAHAKGWPVPEAQRSRMLDALEALLQGRLAAQDWAPRNHLEPQQLAAQATLVEHGRAKLVLRPKALDALSAQSLVDWSRTLMALPSDAERDAALTAAGAQLRSRFDVQGTRLRWRDESAQHWWWFMWSGDSTAARMALLAQQWAQTDAAWKADAPLITQGLVGRQDAGRWSTTTGNAWSTVALRRFQQQFEAGPVDGVTHATLGRTTRDAAWADAKAPGVLLPWPAQGAQGTLQLRHEGNGKPWATVSTLASVRNAQPVANGLVVRRTVTPVERKRKGQWSVGDVYRVRLDLESTAEQTWVVVRDAVPSGASQLGRGLGRESNLAQRGESDAGWTWPSHIERATDSYRAYFRYVPRGNWRVEYTVRLNNAGEFKLPPVRAEAMYAPEVFGEGTAQTMTVKP